MANFDDTLILDNLYVYKSVYLTNAKIALAKYNTAIDLGLKTITSQDPVYSWTRLNAGIQYGDSDNNTNIVGKSVYISGTDINLSADAGTNKKITMVSSNLDIVTGVYNEIDTGNKSIKIYGTKTETVTGNVTETYNSALNTSVVGRVDLSSTSDFMYLRSYKTMFIFSDNSSISIDAADDVIIDADDDIKITSKDDINITNAGSLIIHNKGTSAAPLASAQTTIGLSLDGSNLSVSTTDESLDILSDQGIFERAANSTFTMLSRDTSVTGSTKTISRSSDADSNDVAIFIGSNYGDIDIKTKNSKSIYVNSAKNYSVSAAGTYTSSITGVYTSTVGGNYTNTITGTGSIQSTGDFTLGSGDEITLSATNAVYINSKAGSFLFRDQGASLNTSTHINADKDKLELWAANGGGNIFVVSTVAGQGATPITIADTTGYDSTSGTTTSKIFLASDTGHVDIKAKGVDHNIYLTANQGSIASLAKDYTTEYSNSYAIQSTVQISGRDYKSGLTLGSTSAELRGVYGVTLKSNSAINLNGATTNIYSDRTNPGGVGYINIITDSDYVTGGSNGYIHIYSGNVVDVKADTSIDLAAITSISSTATTSNTMTGKSIVIEANATTASNGGISIQSTGANNANDILVKHAGSGSVKLESVSGGIDIKSSKSGVNIQNLLGSGSGATNTAGIYIHNQGSDIINIHSENKGVAIDVGENASDPTVIGNDIVISNSTSDGMSIIKAKGGVRVENTDSEQNHGILIKNQGLDKLNIQSLNSAIGLKATTLVLTNADTTNNTLYGTTIPSTGEAGQIFFKVVS